MTSLDYLNILNGSQMSLLHSVPNVLQAHLLESHCIIPFTLFILQLTSISFLSLIEIFEKKVCLNHSIFVSFSFLTAVKQSDTIIFRLRPCLKNRPMFLSQIQSDLVNVPTVMSVPNGR